jgi:hypothetical protein
MDKTHTSLDKNNSSSVLLYANFVKRGRATRINQGQPTTLQIRQAGLTTAHIHFKYIGAPLSYQIILTNVSGMKYYSVDHDEFVSAGGYYKVKGLVPKSVYEVNVIAYYVSGDIFSLNFPKSFETATVEGAVRTISFQNPTNQTYTFNRLESDNTTFDIIFTPLKDIANYEVIVKGVSDIVIPYSNTALQFKTNVRDVSFNSTYDIDINSIYGSIPDGFTYSTIRPHATLNENFKCDLSTVSVLNTFVDLSYSFVDIPSVVYKLYLEDICVKTDTVYTGIFHLSDLSINKRYGNTYASVTYPESGNEYKTRIQDVSFITLDEGDTTITNILIRNTRIDISFSNQYGSSKHLKYKITDVAKNTTTTGFGSPFATTSRNTDVSCAFTNLNSDTEYKISINTEYATGHIYTDCSLTVRTLNEGSVQNFRTEHPDIDTTQLFFDPSPNASDLSIFQYTLYAIDPETKQTGALLQTDALSFDAVSVLFPGLDRGSSFKILFTSAYLTTQNEYTSDIGFETISDLDTYNHNSAVTATSVTGNSVVLELANGSYYRKHDISYSKINSTSINSAAWSKNTDSYEIHNLVKDTSYNIEVTSFITEAGVGYNHTPTQIRTLNESAADIANIEISDTTAKITWESNLDISYILIKNIKVTDFSFVYHNLNMNTTYDFSFSTVFKTSHVYFSEVTVKTLHEKSPIYFIDTYFDGPENTTARIEVQNTNQSDVSNTIINFGTGSYSTCVLDLSMINRYSNYSGNIVTTYNQTLSVGDNTYKTRSYVTDFSFVTIMYKPIYHVLSGNIYMEWYPLSSPSLMDVSFTIIITEAGGNYTETFDLDNTKSSHEIENLSIDTSYDISFVRRFETTNTTRTEFQTVTTQNEGRAYQ